MKTAIVAGSFDPVTLGHVELFRRAAGLFDRIIVGAVVNAEKHYCFTPEERLAFIQDAIRDIPNAQAVFFGGMLYDLIHETGACALVKGIRAPEDVPYEIEQADFNRLHAPECETVFLPALPGMEQLSSTFVKEQCRLHHDISACVTPMVAQALIQRFNKE